MGIVFDEPGVVFDDPLYNFDGYLVVPITPVPVGTIFHGVEYSPLISKPAVYSPTLWLEASA